MIGAYTIISGIVEHNRSTPSGTFDSGLINAGKSFPFVFDKAGEYLNYRTIDPWMTGMVTIS
jgi:plastocyanin